MDRVRIRPFTPHDRDWLVAQHGTLYAQAEGFDASFGALVAEILDQFIVHHDSVAERGWIAEDAGRRLGSIFCVRLSETTAKLRLFLLVPEARGKGLGKRLLRTCMGFAKAQGYRDMQLWTHESHAAACALYRAEGWDLLSAKPVHSFGQDLVEQSWAYRF
ncbi:GNAT family N-acetyltransferase [Roseobacter sinensis]|uniref:GNAT family N-acetyltransferase n=1 Tax=Roseobacter sinensis TaxID=2931391 RepID=A0ABT3BGD6_9RHOB|nr:GNAT family N-acetyltransferase [Roseobacter sp. WL0113]MCV3272628.1 GNAT family N-acetyltransferase [Roseobacter sp. WL0113]